MTEAERDAVLDRLQSDPQAGEIIPGGGGVRKVRIAREGGGRSGGYRVISYFMTMDEPVFLLSVLSKTRAANLTDAQKGEVKAAAKTIKRER